MRTIIAGSRDLTNPSLIDEAVNQANFLITEVISGAARGVDTNGERWARLNNIPVRRFPAEWAKHGKKAGYLRNEEMAANADALIAIWDGKSRGTKHMIDIATRLGLKVHIFRPVYTP
jgi:hypothetical protein